MIDCKICVIDHYWISELVGSLLLVWAPGIPYHLGSEFFIINVDVHAKLEEV